MEMKVQVPYQQILTLVKTLSPTQKIRLRKELDEQTSVLKQDDFLDYLLNGPVYSDEDISVIEENHKSISKWRTKS